MTPRETAVAQLTEPGVASKKYQITVAGLVFVGTVFVGSAAVCLYSPANAASIIELAKTALTAAGSVVAVFTGAEAFVNRGAIQALK